METRISGIPCIVKLDRVIGKYKPAKIYADPEDCYEAQYPEVEYSVFDRKGYPAPWLVKKLTCQDDARIQEELLEEISDAF